MAKSCIKGQKVLYEWEVPKESLKDYCDSYFEYGIYGDKYKILESPKHPTGILMYYENEKTGTEGVYADSSLPLIAHLFKELQKTEQLLANLAREQIRIEEEDG